MKQFISWSFLLIVLSCQQRQQYPIAAVIVAPELELQQLSRLNEKIASQPSNLLLRKQRFAINSRLKWPQNASEDLDFIIKNEGLSYEIYNQALDFYEAYHYYELMLHLLDQWTDFANVPEDIQWRIKALIGLGRIKEAEYTLWEYLQGNKKNEESLIFISLAYLKIGLKLEAVYSFNLLSKVNSNHEILLKAYVPLLMEMHKTEKAQQVLAQFEISPKDTLSTFQLAELAFETADYRTGQRLLSSYKTESAFLKKSNGFIKEGKLDSASFWFDQAIQLDSSSVSLYLKGQLMENQYNRIWVAKTYYDLSLKMDSTHRNARESSANVDRKIAYLRSLKERDLRTPILEISSKKETENE